MKKIFLLSLFLFCSQVYAQNMASLLSPHAPDLNFLIDGGVFNDQKEWGVMFDQKIVKNEKHRLSLSGRYRELNLEQALPVLPNDYETAEVGFQYTKYLEQRKFWAIQSRFGSASDQIFNNSEVNTFTTNFLYKASDKWLFLANYSNNRSFLNNIPLPSVMYIHTMSREKVVLLGLPFVFIKADINEKFAYTISSFIPRSHNLALHYRINRGLELSLGIEQDFQTYLRSERINEEERIFLRKRNAYLNLKTSYKRLWELNLKSGYGFGHQLSESESYSDDDRTEVKLEDGVFAVLSFDFKVF